MKHAAWILFLPFLVISGFGQEKIEVFYENSSEGEYKFYAINPNFCTYTLELDFSELHNLKGSVSFPFRMEVDKGQNYLFTLKRVQNDVATSFRFNSGYHVGCINPDVDENFIYLLPIAQAKKTQTFELDYFKINKSAPEPKNFYALGFLMPLGDTIFAARRGVVSDLKDGANLAHSNYEFTTTDNFIQIFHDDCSFGIYEIFQKSLVKRGQEVEAGDPIAISGGEKYEVGPHFRFEVYYNDEEKFTKKKEEAKRVHYWAYVPMHFYTVEDPDVQLKHNDSYTSIHPESMITQEMNKREKKKWSKQKRNF